VQQCLKTYFVFSLWDFVMSLWGIVCRLMRGKICNVTKCGKSEGVWIHYECAVYPWQSFLPLVELYTVGSFVHSHVTHGLEKSNLRKRTWEALYPQVFIWSKPPIQVPLDPLVGWIMSTEKPRFKYLDVCVLGICCEMVRYYLLDITALSELETQAFLYTHNNIC
jgi:hypothetical protein